MRDSAFAQGNLGGDMTEASKSCLKSEGGPGGVSLATRTVTITRQSNTSIYSGTLQSPSGLAAPRC